MIHNIVLVAMAILAAYVFSQSKLLGIAAIVGTFHLFFSFQPIKGEYAEILVWVLRGAAVVLWGYSLHELPKEFKSPKRI